MAWDASSPSAILSCKGGEIMSGKRDNLHMAILKYGGDKYDEGVKFSDLKNHIDTQRYPVSELRLKNLFFDSYETLHPEDKKDYNQQFADDVQCALRIDSTFRLIDYEELQHANRSSKKATYWASAALAVSVISSIISIYYSHQQMSTPTTIDPNQVAEILQLKYDDHSISQKMDEILKNQELFLDEN